MSSSRSTTTAAALALAGAFLAATSTTLEAQRPLNLDFERASVGHSDRPWGWAFGWSAFGAGPSATFTLDTLVRAQGKRSLRIETADTAADAPARTLMLQVPAEFARGKTLRLRGKLRAEGSGTGSLAIEAWGDRVVAAGDSAVIRGGAAARWVPVDLAVRVPADPGIHSIVFIVGAAGKVTAWSDALALTVDGVATTTLPATAPPPTAVELRWLGERSSPLAAVLPAGPPVGVDSAALARFGAIVGDARVVGLGESTHGTREFFQMKHRLVRYLVEEKGFDLFAVEANQMAVRRMDAYVMGGPGTTRDAMRVMFRVWNTEEMLALVDWLREWNRTHPARPVRFVGYDMQDHRTPIDSLHAFVARVEPDLGPLIDERTMGYRTQSSYATPQVAESIRADWAAMADSLVRLVEQRRTRWLAAARSAPDSVAVEWAVHAAELYAQAARFNVTLFSPARDSLMAADLDWALRVLFPRSRVMVWAHDVHVSHGGDRQRSFNGGAQMGAHLKRTFHHDYRAFSLLTSTGSYSATRSFTDHTMGAREAFAAPAGSVEAALGTVPRPAGSVGLITDLRIPAADRAGGWLWTPRPIRSIGFAAYDYGFDLTAVMPLEFDGAIYVERTTPSRLLP